MVLNKGLRVNILEKFKTSGYGKLSASRVSDLKEWGVNYDSIFRKNKSKKRLTKKIKKRSS